MCHSVSLIVQPIILSVNPNSLCVKKWTLKINAKSKILQFRIKTNIYFYSTMKMTVA